MLLLSIGFLLVTQLATIMQNITTLESFTKGIEDHVYVPHLCRMSLIRVVFGPIWRSSLDRGAGSYPLSLCGRLTNHHYIDHLINRLYLLPYFLTSYKGSMSKFLEKYETGEKVGEGTDGVVRVCYHKEKKKRYAVKSMRMEEEQVLFLKRNFLSITHLHHCNVIKYQGLYLDMKRHTANLVMEYETMKPLNTFSHFTQGQLKSIMKQLL